MTKAELEAKYPHWTIRQEPWECCHACKGTGEVRGRAPCWCVFSSQPHGKEMTDFMKAIGNAATKAKKDMGL